MSAWPLVCSICNCTETESGEPVGKDRVCDACRKSFALFTPAPTRRPLKPCARCDCRELVRCQVRTPEADRTTQLRPLAATYPSSKNGGDSPDPYQPIGLFEAHVCRSCGFTEWYAREPQAIPIGPEYGTELETAEDPGPYR